MHISPLTDDAIARRILAILGDRTLRWESLFAWLPELAGEPDRFRRILERMEQYPLIFVERREDGSRHVRKPRPLAGWAVEVGAGGARTNTGAVA